ncbi:diaminopimelate epimerase [Coxiella endosymbiont of Amblyomma sculptum]|uniref:diaminopimelate epimerase n=1 Tax=Coxiella endosymbiont of Amblyomma sculptum TaxID=2487929 RepID=UPI00132F168D|nr:diaminopimelate epimerase [Coxiella endosymbiont of Amblyomma sculptum]QHG92395.1 diaminopimelate epimerase [Coxiella endosymbiont of Amblyomma sculptum]
MKIISFTKMHGSGNDFVVIDATKQHFEMTTSQIQKMADRHLGIGFDQLLVIESPKVWATDFHFRIFNSDGSEVSQCGNGACCIARYLYAKKIVKRKFRISTLKDTLELKIQFDKKISVKMGVPRFNPSDIPFIAHRISSFYHIEVDNQKIRLGVVNVGNPHAIVLTDVLNTFPVLRLGAQLSTHKRFPEGTNVGFMQIIDPKKILLRVYERGSGETLSCGSNACAAVAVGRCSGLLGEQVVVKQPGGSLFISWQGPLTQTIMVGSADIIFHGEWSM